MQDLQIESTQGGWTVVLPGDDAYADGLVHLQRNGYNGIPPQVAGAGTGGDGEGVGAHHQIDDGALVGDPDAAAMLHGGQDLFREIGSALLSLIVGQAGVVLQLLQGDGGPPGQRMLLADEDMGLRREQLLKHQPGLPQHTLQHGLVVG